MHSVDSTEFIIVFSYLPLLQLGYAQIVVLHVYYLFVLLLASVAQHHLLHMHAHNEREREGHIRKKGERRERIRREREREEK